jgi:predicted nucleic acid-binding protein
MLEAQHESFVLVVPTEAINEASRVASEKPWLAARIPPDALVQLSEELDRVAEIAPVLDRAPPRLSRDAADDYLLAQALIADVDFLITRDRDLIELDQELGLTSVDPAEFMAMLRSTRA